MLEIFFIFLIIFFVLIFFYKQTVPEFSVLQIESDKLRYASRHSERVTSDCCPRSRSSESLDAGCPKGEPANSDAASGPTLRPQPVLGRPEGQDAPRVSARNQKTGGW
jgi:hypothetical protein